MTTVAMTKESDVQVKDWLTAASAMISPVGFEKRRSAFMFYEQVRMDIRSSWLNLPMKTFPDS